MNSIFYIILAVVTFTSFEPVAKLIASDVNSIAITSIRFLIGGIMLVPLALSDMKKNDIKLVKLDFVKFLFLGTLCVCISMLLLQYAVKFSPSPAIIAIVFSANSVFTILLACFILKEPITLFKAIATILCISGIFVMCNFKSDGGAISIVLAIVSALTFSLFTVIGKKVNTRLTVKITTSFSFIMGGLVLLIYMLITKVHILEGITLSNLWVILYLGFFVTGIGYYGYFTAMEKSSAMAASLVFFIKPILTPFATLMINGIVPDLKVFLALILVLIGSYLGVYKKS